MSERMTLGEAFTIRPVVSATDFVLQLQSGVQDADHTVGEYVVTDSLAAAFDRALDFVGSALDRGQAQGVFIHGSFGSGKSHFMAVLDLILRGSGQARALPGLQQAIAAHQQWLGRRLLTVEYHLIGAKSLEDALFSGYLDTIRREHPDQKLPVLHKSDALLTDATKQLRRAPQAFLAELNAPSRAGGWGSFAGGWTQAGFAAAAAAPVGDPERSRLISDLVATVSTASVKAGEWLDISDGLAVMTAHAKSLGYDGLVLFLDELVLWLAAHLADRDFISTEGSKVAKLVETGTGVRDLPIISFVARQRELQAFLGESSGATGAERMAVGDTFRWWEGRFDKIVLESADLPRIAHKRLLEPAGPAAAARIVAAVQAVKANQGAWDTLLASETSPGESDFAQVYPFSPALVDTLVALSSLLQRERTALKVMAELLAKGRDTLFIVDVIPVGDLYDAIIGSGDMPLTDEVRHVFGVARRLYDDKLRPVLLSSHGLDEAAAATVDRDHPFARDDRLAKTLIIAALVPGVKALSHLTAGRLAALNHGTVRSRFPGNEASIVLTKVRGWAESIGEIEIGAGPDPIISVQLTGVDYDSVLERVAAEDNESTRRTLARLLLFEQLGASQDQSLMGAARFPFVWRGSKRVIEVSFGNIRDTADLPDATFNQSGDSWRLVVDFPFDSAGHSPQDDLSRLDTLREAEVVSRTVAWVPSFLTPARMDDLGKLARLNYLLGGAGAGPAAGGRFDEHAAHLPVDQRPIARQYLENLRSALRTRLIDVLKQAYGVAAGNSADIDTTFGDVTPLVSLQPELVPQRPVGADLRAAMGSLADQMLSCQYPDHPRFEPGTTEVRAGDITSVLAHVRMALDHGGRVDPVEASKRSGLRSVANPLECGRCYESHYVFDAQTFPWRNRFTKWAAADQVAGAVPVASMRRWLTPWGLSRRLENLLILSWALLDDKEFRLHGTPVSVDTADTVRDEYVLRDPVLPDAHVWSAAVARAAIVFGITVPDLCSAANVRRLGAQLRDAAQSRRVSARELVDELSAHAVALGQSGGPETNRVRDARLGRDLVEQLAGESDPLVAMTALSNAPLATEPHPIGTSLSSAHNVAVALRTAAWSVLDPTAELADGDPGAGVPGDRQAAAIVERLREAARQSQAHRPLENPLRLASDEAGKFLAGRVKQPPPPLPLPPPPPPPPPQPPDSVVRHRLNAIELSGVSAAASTGVLRDALSQIESRLSAELAEYPDRRLHIEWWLE